MASSNPSSGQHHSKQSRSRNLARQFKRKLLGPSSSPGGASLSGAGSPSPTMGKSFPAFSQSGSFSGLGPGATLSGSLLLSILDAEGLNASSACDPYCAVRLGKKGKTHRTGVRKKTLSPQWNEVLELDVSGSDSSTLYIYIRDWSRLSKHRTLAAATLDIRDFNSGDEHAIWLELEPAGRLRVIVVFDDTTALFGSSLQDICRREGTNVPVVVRRCVNELERRGLSEVGLYRVAGNKRIVDELIHAFNEDTENVKLDADTVPRASALAVVLKQFLRCLPEPLFTNDMMPAIMGVASMKLRKQDFLASLSSTIAFLPACNRETIMFLMDHFCHVLAKSDVNLMNAEALAVCLAPALFHTENDDEDMAATAAEAARQQAVMLFMLNNWPTIRARLLGEEEPADRASEHDVDRNEESAASEHGVARGTLAASRASGGVSSGQSTDGLDMDDQEHQPYLQPPSEDALEKLSASLLNRFCRRGTIEERRQLCDMLDLEQDARSSLTVASEDHDEAGTRLSAAEVARALKLSSAIETKSTRQLRAQSYARQRKRLSSKSSSRPPYIEVAAAVFTRYASGPGSTSEPSTPEADHSKRPFLTLENFRNATYDLGMFMDGERAEALFEELSNDQGHQGLQQKPFLDWWQKAGRPLAAVFMTGRRRKLFQQAVSYFAFYDRRKHGSISAADFRLLHEDLVAASPDSSAQDSDSSAKSKGSVSYSDMYTNIDRDLDVCLAQLVSLSRSRGDAAGQPIGTEAAPLSALDYTSTPTGDVPAEMKIHLNDFVVWLLRIRAVHEIVTTI